MHAGRLSPRVDPQPQRFHSTPFSFWQMGLCVAPRTVVPGSKSTCEGCFFFSFSDMAVVWGRGSSVGIATSYGLDGPGIECRWGRDFPHSSRLPLEPTKPPIKWALDFFPGAKVAGKWR